MYLLKDIVCGIVREVVGADEGNKMFSVILYCIESIVNIHIKIVDEKLNLNSIQFLYNF